MAALARAETMCRMRKAFESRTFAPTERLGVFSGMCADLSGEQRRDYEEHFCGPGVTELVARDVADVMDMGGFDGCALGTPFTCWVHGTEARTVYYADQVGTEAAPRFAVFAIATEGTLLDDPAPQQETIDRFLERARSGPPRRAGRVLPIPADLRERVKAAIQPNDARALSGQKKQSD